MKAWERDLGRIRELGPDEPHFNEAVQRIWNQLVNVTALADELERQNIELRECAQDCKEKERQWVEECARLRDERDELATLVSRA